MEVVNTFPPNYEKIVKRFPVVKEHEGKIVFTWGDTLHVPGKHPIPRHLFVHEETHTKQQGDDPAAWWERYLNDDQFRMDQEIEAYGNQYFYIRENVSSSIAKKYLEDFAAILSDEVYGLPLTRYEAETHLRKYEKDKREKKGFSQEES